MNEGVAMKIINIGSLNIDHVYSVDHVVKPGETISCGSMKDFCGGKGFNQSVALARAGLDVYHAGKVGADGEMLIDYLKECGANVEYTLVDARHPTGHAIIQVDAAGRNSIVVYPGANGEMTEAEINEILSNFSSGDMLLMQNEVSILPYALKKAHEKGMCIALNPSPIGDLATSPLLKYVHIFILNEIEGYDITGEADEKTICRTLLERYPGCKVVLTLGEKGCVYADGDQMIRQSAHSVHAVDTTAAGDTFTGYFLAGLQRGEPISEVLQIASKASAIAVSRPGAAPSIPARAEVLSTSI